MVEKFVKVAELCKALYGEGSAEQRDMASESKPSLEERTRSAALRTNDLQSQQILLLSGVIESSKFTVKLLD